MELVNDYQVQTMTSFPEKYKNHILVRSIIMHSCHALKSGSTRIIWAPHYFIFETEMHWKQQHTEVSNVVGFVWYKFFQYDSKGLEPAIHHGGKKKKSSKRYETCFYLIFSMSQKVWAMMYVLIAGSTQ